MRRSTRAALLSLAALGAAGLCAPPATAAELLLTYTGAIDPSNSQDQLNIFTGSLSGGTLVVSMLVDTDPLPGATASSFVGPAPGWQLTGNGAASPILSYTASVNGVAFDLCAVVADCGDPAT
ncbi:MAG TPA: hypothetical protein VHX64_18330, partial [Caulobacteraceae bacterium]|nr:hypothetical protein [Caulobacteraceae bacterium]